MQWGFQNTVELYYSTIKTMTGPQHSFVIRVTVIRKFNISYLVNEKVSKNVTNKFCTIICRIRSIYIFAFLN